MRESRILSLAARPRRTTRRIDLGFWSIAQVVVRRDPLENDLAMFCCLLSVILLDQPRMWSGL